MKSVTIWFQETSHKHSFWLILPMVKQNAYPYVTIEEMKANLKAGGLSAAFVDELTRADIIAAVQMAIWTYANASDGGEGGLGYFASINIPPNNK